MVLKTLLNGALVMACLACALFFVRFWRESRDRLFALFALSFTVMSLNWFALSLLPVDDERRSYVYVIRLVSFLLILFAIWDKNRASRQKPS
ncbi:hypothetical protein SAMN05444354_117115 [Stigmatella aurantiaca]|uniref:Lipoprotein n=1 Tax=Stigmatella aurantiaca TaxID=41 RepID=A0A1H7YT50_STIAU|nr:DUF5985 family protein [Stigmatella aurantiaca]SEM48339.1 hypothetical protein SAMN05444354_117115 [Stigmatella aurantiaca]